MFQNALHALSQLAESTPSNPPYIWNVPSQDVIWILAFLIPLLPYLAFFIILFVGFKKENDNLNHNISILANLGSFIIAVFLALIQLFQFVTKGEMYVKDISLFAWAPPLISNGWKVDIGILIDPLSTIMFTLVSFLALLIQVYGKAYMKGEKGVTSGRYNAEISLFVGSMLLLTLSSNQLVFFLGWELMGLCSYLLIGFFIDKDSKVKDDIKNAPSSAAKKAFIVTKIGDVLLMAGIALLFYFMVNSGNSTYSQNPLDFLTLQAAFGDTAHPIMTKNWQNIIAFLLFAGAVGKSAQFPLHVWLPDAMEGPTTVSALIHSATMVKAGVFLVARNYYLFQGTDTLLLVGAVGGFTAIFAATMAFVADDVKRVLAYSTISQLGYMFLGLGAGSLTGGMFHLISHSFFKCLLFLDAGALIHAVHSNDMWDMGGLKDKMPWTFRTMVVGGLGLSGFVFFNGFYSKDGVISAAGIMYTHSGGIHQTVYGFMFLAGLITAFLTAFYTFRMIFTVFYGKPRYDEEHVHPHEAPSLMRYPLIIIASVVFGTGILSTEGFIGSALQALFGIESNGKPLNITGNLNIFNENILEKLFEGYYFPRYEGINPANVITKGQLALFKVYLPLLALIFVILGIYIAFLMYHPKGQLQGFPDALNKSIIGRPIATILIQKYYIDALYVAFAEFIRDVVAEVVRMADSVIDFVVDRIGRGTKNACGYAVAIDENVIDGTVRKLSGGTFALGQWLRKRQSGVLENYNQQLVLGLIAIIIIILGYFYIYPTYF